MRIVDLNTAGHDDAAAVLRPCLDVDRWIEAVLAGRPYASLDDVVERARTAADPLLPDEVTRALAHHPRIGERATGSTAEARMSSAEQAGTADAGTARALSEGNHAYEERFGRVFLVRAAGRTPEEILAILRSRLENPPDVEATVVAEQLREIAVLRLRGVLTS